MISRFALTPLALTSSFGFVWPSLSLSEYNDFVAYFVFEKTGEDFIKNYADVDKEIPIVGWPTGSLVEDTDFIAHQN